MHYAMKYVIFFSDARLISILIHWPMEYGSLNFFNSHFLLSVGIEA